MNQYQPRPTLSADEFRQALHALGWKQIDLARRIDMQPVTVNRWATGKAPCPVWLAEYLGAMLDLKALHTKYLSRLEPDGPDLGNQSPTDGDLLAGL